MFLMAMFSLPGRRVRRPDSMIWSLESSLASAGARSFVHARSKGRERAGRCIPARGRRISIPRRSVGDEDRGLAVLPHQNRTKLRAKVARRPSRRRENCSSHNRALRLDPRKPRANRDRWRMAAESLGAESRSRDPGQSEPLQASHAPPPAHLGSVSMIARPSSTFASAVRHGNQPVALEHDAEPCAGKTRHRERDCCRSRRAWPHVGSITRDQLNILTCPARSWPSTGLSSPGSNLERQPLRLRACRRRPLALCGTPAHRRESDIGFPLHAHIARLVDRRGIAASQLSIAVMVSAERSARTAPAASPAMAPHV